MPCFGQWGLLPEGHEGPQDDPFLVLPEPEGSASETSRATTVKGPVDLPPRAIQQHTPALTNVGGTS